MAMRRFALALVVGFAVSACSGSVATFPAEPQTQAPPTQAAATAELTTAPTQAPTSAPTTAAPVVTPVPATPVPTPTETPARPPDGAIWFGTSFSTTTFEVSGHGSTFSQSDHVIMVASLSVVVKSGQALSLFADGSLVKSQTATADWDTFGVTLVPTVFGVGTHTFEVRDSAGNTLAKGTVTFTP